MSGLGWRDAVHETWHTIVAVLFGCEIRSAAIHERGGGVAYAVSTDKVLGARQELHVAVAGHVAERLILGSADARRSREDLCAAYTAALVLSNHEDRGRPEAALVARARQIVADAEREVRELLDRHRVVLRTVAAALQDYGFLNAAQIAALVEEGRRRQIEDDIRWRKRA